jgi:hypothetical protein
MTDQQLQDFLEAAYGDKQAEKIQDDPADIDEALYCMMVVAVVCFATVIMLFSR